MSTKTKKAALLDRLSIGKENELIEELDVLKEVKEGRKDIAVEDIVPDPEQPRKVFTKEAMEELKNTIKEYGILEPIVVREKEGKCQIVIGERRWRAAKELNWDSVSCIIRNYNDNDAFTVSLTENVQRDNLTSIEEAMGYQKMLDKKIAKNHAEIAKWRRRQSILRTLKRRPDLLQGAELSDDEKQDIIDNIIDIEEEPPATEDKT